MIIGSIIVLAGCELFIPREADPPIDQADPYAFQQPTTPEKVLEDISNAFPAGNQDYYLDVLVEGLPDEASFAFDPDPLVAQGHSGVFDGWGYAEEATFVTNLFQRMNSGALQSFQWSDLQLTTVENQTQIQVEYSADLSLMQEQTQLPNSLAGRAYLTLLRGDDDLYRILSWQDEDVSSDSLPCWSALKAGLQ